MIYIYTYPIESFDRNITDKNLIKAYLKKSVVERYTLESFIEALNDENFNPVTHWVKAIDDNAGYYSIATVHKDDLKQSGFNVRKVTESDMMTLADKMGDDYLDWSFWDSLKIIAEIIGIPRLKKDKSFNNKLKTKSSCTKQKNI